VKFIALLFLLLTTLAGQAYAQTSPTPTIGPGVIWTPQQWIAAWSSKIDTSPATGGPTIATALLGSGTVLSPNVLPPATQTVAGILSLAAANAAAAIQSAGPGLSLVGTALGLPTFGTPGVYSNLTLDAYGRVTAARAINATDVNTALGNPSSYLGEVATRAAVPNFYSAGYKTFMSRSTHYARRTITSLQIVVPNFYVLSGTGEVTSGGVATYTASIEYPAGSFHQITFGGATAGTVAAGSELLSDPVSVSIPNGRAFWVRMFYTNPNGGGVFRLYTVNQTAAVAFGDATNYTSSPTDQTMGGTVFDTSPLVQDFPAAIVANTTQASICLIGDSRVLGTSDAGNDDTLDTGPIGRYLGKKYGYINMGISGDTANAFVGGSHTNRVALGAYCSVGIDEYGINDVVSAVTSAQLVGFRTSIAGLFPTLQVYGTTLEPETTSTDNWATPGNQTLNAYNSVRNTFNAAVLAGIPGELDYIDTAGMVDPINSGLWPTTGTAFGCTLDGVHENATSAQLSNNGNVCGVYNNPFRNIDFSRR
jgi:hypothetical protein